MARVFHIPDVDYRIEVTCIEDISLIKDPINSVFAQRDQLPSITILIHFKGPSILADPIKILDSSIDIEIRK